MACFLGFNLNRVMRKSTDSQNVIFGQSVGAGLDGDGRGMYATPVSMFRHYKAPTRAGEPEAAEDGLVFIRKHYLSDRNRQ